ncbi:MAG: ATP-binding protein [Pseudomonadales bacterium]|nr:ATP-binding protein [Pseudomonadales bacterium]
MIRKKLFRFVAVVVLVAALFAGASYFIRSWVILPSFVELEQKAVQADFERVLEAIQREAVHVQLLAGDWAVWDDTYEFIVDLNPEYIQSNLAWESLSEASGIHLIYFMDERGELRWGEAYSPVEGRRVLVPEFDAEIQVLKPKWLHSAEAQSGVILTGLGPMFISAWPILQSAGDGPSRGTLFMGRFMSAEVLAELQEQVKVEFKAYPVPDFLAANPTIPDLDYGSAEQRNNLLDRLAGKKMSMTVMDEFRVRAMGIINDFAGNPALFIVADLDREIMAQGHKAARLVTVSVMITLLVIVLVLFSGFVLYSIGIRRTNKIITATVTQRTRELNEAKLQAEEATQSALQANEAKTEFLANISHEVRTPLNGIIGMAQLAGDTTQDINLRNICTTILREADALIGLINDTLDLSKIEAGRMELEIRPFNCVEHIEDIACDVALRMEGKDIEVTCYVAPDVPVWICGDARRLRQVLLNLAYNALKFTLSGEVRLRLTRTDQSGDVLTLKFEVEDTGIGIAPEKQGDIFQRFTQADGSMSRRFGGTGLGTSIAKELVELMNGEIGLNSQLGQGSTFWFTAEFGFSESREVAGEMWKVPQPERILVADGCPSSAANICAYLEALGFESVTVSSFDEALDVATIAELDDAPFKLMLAEEKIIADAHGESIEGLPIIVMSRIGQAGLLDFGQLSSDSIKGLLIKPVRWSFLCDHLCRVLHGHGIARSASRDSSGSGSSGPISAKVLLVEDYVTNQQIALAHLRSAGLTVELAENGAEAVAAFKSGEFDLVFMDLQMPDMDGYEATRIIRETERERGVADHERVPIIAMSAHALKEYKDRCLASGMDDFFAKPFKRESLIAKVRDWLYRSTSVNYLASTGDCTSESEGIDYTSESAVVIDLEQAVAEFMGDRQTVEQTLTAFLAECRQQINKMKQAYAAEDWPCLANEAHRIKGGAANLTAKILSSAASLLETASRAGDKEGCATALKNVTDALKELEQEVKEKLIGV